MKKKVICVFCGSNLGNDPIYEKTANELAELLIMNDLGMVYGGGNRGLMGIVAKRMFEAGSTVIGISPRRFHKEGREIPSSEYILVDTMHQRKELMYKKADAYLALPGGIGTIEEVSEIFTWNTIGFSSKPVAILNVNHFYDPFVQQLRVMEQTGFLPTNQYDRLIIRSSASEVLTALLDAQLVDAPWEALH